MYVVLSLIICHLTLSILHCLQGSHCCVPHFFTQKTKCSVHFFQSWFSVRRHIFVEKTLCMQFVANEMTFHMMSNFYILPSCPLPPQSTQTGWGPLSPCPSPRRWRGAVLGPATGILSGSLPSLYVPYDETSHVLFESSLGSSQIFKSYSKSLMTNISTKTSESRTAMMVIFCRENGSMKSGSTAAHNIVFLRKS